MAENAIVMCKYCRKALPLDYEGNCPYCGKAGKQVIASFRATVGLKATEEYEGIYEVPEAARYIAATTTLFSRQLKHISSRNLLLWIKTGLALPTLSNIPAREMVITFEDMISMRIIALLRAAGISFPKIKEAEKYLRKLTGNPRPFATEQIWIGYTHIFSEFEAFIVAASKSGQMGMDFIKEDLKSVHGLTFNERHVASTWAPYRDILLSPSIQFGRPCIAGTRIPTKTLANMVRAGDAIEFVAESYGLEMNKVKHAFEWENILVTK